MVYTITTCNDRKEAVEFYKSHFKEIDLLIIDLMMPELSGYDCFVELKKINPNIKAIISTGYSIDGGASKIIREGAVGFIKKPFKINELSKAVHNAMSKDSHL